MLKRKKFVLTTGDANRNGRKINLEGLDITNFLKNPVMFYNHATWDMPVGRWENIQFEYDDNGKPIRLIAEAVFDTEGEQGANVARLVEKGFLKGVSIGYTVFEDEWQTITQLVNGVPQNSYLRLIKKAEIREASIVNIPANETSLIIESYRYSDTYKGVQTSDFLKDFVGAETQHQDNVPTKNPSNFMKFSKTLLRLVGLFPTIDSVQQTDGGIQIPEAEIDKVVNDITKLQAEKDDLSKKLADKENELKTAKDKLQQSEEDLQAAKDKIAELEDKIAMKSGKPLSKGEDNQPTGDTNTPKFHYATVDDLD